MKFGKAFSDNVVFEKKRRGIFSTSMPSWWFGTGRTLLFTTVVFVAFFVLLLRLFTLTVVQGHYYRRLSDTNRTKQLVIHAPRGNILDRTGKQFAFNTPYIRLLKPCDDKPTLLCTSRITTEEADTIRKNGVPSSWYLEQDYKREYSSPEAMFHVLGYVGEINEKELKDNYYQLRNYKMGDVIGRMGVEAVFEEDLRGKDGREFVEVDSNGAVLRVLGKTPSIPGVDIMLSLDKGLADAVYQAFPKDQKGAVIVSKPTTGEILALFSSPTFSSNLMTNGIDPTLYQSLMSNPDRPFFNRGIGGSYPPGSIFKLVTSTAGLEEGVISGKTLIEDIGEIAIGPYKFPTWNFIKTGKTDGMMDVTKALQKSNDIYFYKVGEGLGITKFGTWAKKMGVGTILGIELPGEATGLMPNPAWKDERFHSEEDLVARNNEWYLGDTYHASIGQGYVLTTPLQGNTWTNVIANGGKLCQPTIKKVHTENDKKGKCTDIGVKKDTVDLVTKGMIKACKPGGTGYPLFEFGVKKSTLPDGSTVATTSGTLVKIPVACKTGTAEFGDPTQKTHAWFTVFAPVPEEYLTGELAEPSSIKPITGDPEISITVLLEEGGEGSDKAAPIAKKILEEWFNR